MRAAFMVLACTVLGVTGCQSRSVWDYCRDRDYLSAIKAAKESGDLNARDSYGWTVLIHVSYYGTPEEVRTAIGSGCDPNMISGVADWNAALAAADAGRWDNVRVLLDAGTSIDQVDRVGKESLAHYAARQKSRDALALVIGHGANINLLNAQGRSPLFFAVADSESSADCIKVLLDAGARLHDGTTGMSEVERAKWVGRDDLVKLLSNGP